MLFFVPEYEYLFLITKNDWCEFWFELEQLTKIIVVIPMLVKKKKKKNKSYPVNFLFIFINLIKKSILLS